MPLDWSPFVDFVGSHQRFLIMTHVRPDGDAIGSQVGLACAIRQLGKSARIVVASNLGPRYEFLNPGGNRIERFVPPGDAYEDVDAIIVIDTGTWNQLGDFAPYMKSRKVGKAVIDHHRTQDDLGGLAFVDTSAEAAGRLAYEATMALGVPVTAEAADAMFMALATDTGWFRHASTTPKTFELAEILVKAGANPTKIYEEIYEQTNLPRLKLTGRALERLDSVGNGKILFTEIYRRDFPETGSVPGDTEDLINYPRAVVGSMMAMIFIEQEDGTTKVSFRAREPYDVSRIAEQFGGGGHKLAAGATVLHPLAEAKRLVLQAALAVL
jgi:bifunctional oligoribonuclease and PAP phosphatase NrnA